MVGMSNRTSVGIWGALLVGSLAVGCVGAGAGSDSTELAYGAPTRGPAGRGRPRFGERHGFSFGTHGIPGGHGFRGHGGKICSGSGGAAGGKGTGGAGGLGGRAGAGGMSGGLGGAGGMGGGTQPMICSGTQPARALITDFSDAGVGTSGIFFGTEPNIDGGAFTFAATGLAAPVLSLAPAPAGSTGQALQVVANPGTPTDPSNAFLGFGLGFGMCVDASAYTGIQFTITGDIGDCSLAFSPQFSEDNSVTDDPMFGSCTAASCFPPASGPIGTGTTVVEFANVAGGAPVTTVDPRALTGVQWQMVAPTDGVSSCSANFAVTDIAFVNGAGGAGGMSGGGGTGGRAPVACVGSPPATPLITGSTATPAGGTFTFNSPDLAAPTLTTALAPDGSIQALQVTATPGTTTDPFNAFTGFGLFFSAPPCVNATQYNGVAFNLTGDLGTCGLNVFVVTNEDQTVGNGGTCPDAGSCVSPFSAPLAVGPQLVHFSDLSGGIPDAVVDPTAINGIGWTLNVPTDGVTAPCTASFTISKVSFVNQ
jgi:hypothetical protein